MLDCIFKTISMLTIIALSGDGGWEASPYGADDPAMFEYEFSITYIIDEDKVDTTNLLNFGKLTIPYNQTKMKSIINRATSDGHDIDLSGILYSYKHRP